MSFRILPIAAAFAVFAACSQQPVETPDAGPPPNKCVGGIINDAGVCEAKCDPSKCLANNTCVDNKCQLKCTAHSQCKQYTQQCLPAKEDGTGADIFVCTNTPPVEIGDPCPNGNECADYCANFDGPGDTNAYCTVFCSQDTDCPGGYECGMVRDPHQICGTMKGNNNLCGKTSEPCIDKSVINAPDSGYVESQFCLEKKVCLRKDQCATCESNVDCSYGTDLDCAPIGNTKRCLARCSASSDCEGGKSCQDGHCTPVDGSCTGTGFCTICRYDTDCGMNFACEHLHGNEHSCVDETFGTACTTDADCPVSPTGKHGNCLDDRLGVQPGDSVYHHCYVPYENELLSCY